VINNAIRRLLASLDRAGSAKQIPDSLVDSEERVVEALGVCKSDDPHVIALARAARVRLLCTLDENLQQDFRCKQLVDRPRGHIYKNSGHKHLLKTHCS